MANIILVIVSLNAQPLFNHEPSIHSIYVMANIGFYTFWLRESGDAHPEKGSPKYSQMENSNGNAHIHKTHFSNEMIYCGHSFEMEAKCWYWKWVLFVLLFGRWFGMVCESFQTDMQIDLFEAILCSLCYVNDLVFVECVWIRTFLWIWKLFLNVNICFNIIFCYRKTNQCGNSPLAKVFRLK